MNNPQDDLAYIKQMAEAGRNTPLQGGPSFMLWGGVIGTAALYQYLIIRGWAPIFIPSLYLWLGAIATGWVVGYFLTKKYALGAGANSFGNLAAARAWSGCGLFITTYFLSIVAGAFGFRDSSYPIGDLAVTMFPVAFGLYAICFWVTAQAANIKWLDNVAILSLVMVPIMVLTIPYKENLLLAALATYALVFVPGFIMHRHERKANSMTGGAS